MRMFENWKQWLSKTFYLRVTYLDHPLSREMEHCDASTTTAERLWSDYRHTLITQAKKISPTRAASFSSAGVEYVCLRTVVLGDRGGTARVSLMHFLQCFTPCTLLGSRSAQGIYDSLGWQLQIVWKNERRTFRIWREKVGAPSCSAWPTAGHQQVIAFIITTGNSHSVAILQLPHFDLARSVKSIAIKRLDLQNTSLTVTQ